MAIYIKLEITGSLGAAQTYESFELVQFYNENDVLISIGNTNLVSHNYINRATATDTAKWFVPSDGNVPYDTPNNKGILIIKMPDTATKIKKVLFKSYSNTGSASNIEVFYSEDNTTYISKGKITFDAISQTKELILQIGISFNRLLLSQQNKYISTIKSGLTDNLVPLLTSNTSAGTAVNSAHYNGYEAFRAFDQNSTTPWYAPLPAPWWLQYSFTDKKLIVRYGIKQVTASANNNPRSWTFEGSNDGINWTVLNTVNNYTIFKTTEYDYFDFENKTAYTSYRLNVSEVYASGNGVMVYEMTLIGKIEPQFITIDNVNEDVFLQYGTPEISIENYNIIKDVILNNTTLESGKTFEHTVDISKRNVKKITLS